jgi:thioredoxin-related protein
MKNIHKKTELVANLLIIIAALLVVGVLMQRSFSLDTAASPSGKVGNQAEPQLELPKPGDKVLLENVDWSKSDKNVLLILQKGCQYCSDGAEFYQKLIQQSQRNNIRFIAVLPQDRQEAEKYLASLNISSIEVRQSQLSSLLVAGTPTIIVANDKGEVVNVWFGKLSPDKEQEVLGKLT